MKNIHILLIALLLLGSCTDPEIIPFSEATIAANATCFDGIRNQDEEEVDCGGVCTACLPPAAPCTDVLQDNTIHVNDDDGLGYTDKVLTSLSCSYNSSWDYYSITGSGSNISVKIEVNGVNNLDTERTYAIEYSSAAEALVFITYEGVQWRARNGTLYVYNSDSGTVLEFCESGFDTNFVQYYPVFSGRLICN